VEQGKQERRAAWSQLRDRLIQRVGRGKNDLSAQDAPGLLAALDRLIGDRALADDEKISRLAERFCGGELGPDAVVAEMQLLSSEPELAPSGGPGSEGPVVQLFQPEWQVGSSPDDLSVACDAGEDVRIVGLAESSAGVTRVLLDGQVLSAGSLGGKDLKLVSRQAENSLRFDGILHSGDQPSVAVLTAVDALGARKMLRLSLRPRPASGAAGVALRSNTVAVIGLTKREVDQYEELRAVRIGQGLQQQLTRAVRDVAAFTLVEEKAEVVRALSDRQWLEKSAAFDPSMAVQTGKLLGARYVLYGEVYDFASPKENRGKLFIAVALRLVDVETGRYVPGDGQATVDVRKGEHGDDSFDRTTLAEASDKAIHAALQDLMKTNAAHSIPQPVMG
jgi:curli biogenesis system outer membrane secretion channel CsgG